MKKLVLILMLFPLYVFADSEILSSRSYTKNDSCATTTDPAEKRECLDAEKNNEAQQNFENFQENMPSAYQNDF